MLRYFPWRARVIRALLARRGAALVHVVGAEARRDLALIRETHTLVPLLMQDAAALQILAAVRGARVLGGAMAEAGVFAGGSARLICSAKGDAPLHLFDVFETLQRGGSRDAASGADEVYGHFGETHVARAEVERLLAPFSGVHIHAGLFPDSARGLESLRFSFVHLDLDLETGTRAALAFFGPRMLPGGVIIGDDYHLSGVRRAFDDHVHRRGDLRIELPWGQVMVIATAGNGPSG
jgi:hypothetical protein